MFRSLSIFAMTLILTACGGGGGTEIAQILNGVMLDSPVEGLAYKTSTQNGLTDANGNYKYQKGESVTFTFYGTEIGTTLASNVNTPIDLIEKGTLASYTLNILRLLQSLDIDSNLANGIKLPTLNFNKKINFDKSLEEFAIDSNVLELLTLANKTLVSSNSALTHFSGILNTNSLVKDYSISLIGKKITETITDSRCPRNVATIVTKFISETRIEMMSNDFIEGTCNYRAQENTTYNSISNYQASQFVVGDPFSCLPICTYAKLNGFYEKTAGSIIVQRMGSHVQGSNSIRYSYTELSSADRTNVIVKGISTAVIDAL